MKERYGRNYIYHMDGKTYYIYLTDHERDLFERCHGIVLQLVDAPKDQPIGAQSMKDCRNCIHWESCPCGKQGHEKGTSIGYSIGECKDYSPKSH